MKKFSYLILVIFFLGMASCKQSGEGVDGDKPDRATENKITITDHLGREVSLDAPARRIVFIHFATAEVLNILGSWDKVVGRDVYTSDPLVFPNIEQIPKVVQKMGNPYAANFEKIIELQPDLVIAEIIPTPGIEDFIATLESTTSVACFKFYSPSGFSEELKNLAVLLGKEKEADEYLQWYGPLLKKIEKKTASLKPDEMTPYFYKTGYGDVSEINSFSDELSGLSSRNKITGGRNIAANLPSAGGWITSIDKEWLLGQDYRVLVVGDPLPTVYGVAKTDYKPLIERRKQVMELPEFSNSQAVKTGKTYMFCSSFFGTPRFIVGYAYLAKWFHPELFHELDPKAIHQEYLNRFMRVDVDLSRMGVFVYPEE